MPSLTAPIAYALKQKGHQYNNGLPLLQGSQRSEIKQLKDEISAAAENLKTIIRHSELSLNRSLTGQKNILTEQFFGRALSEELRCWLCGRNEYLCIQSSALNSRGRIRPELDTEKVRTAIVCSRCIRQQKHVLVDLNGHLLIAVKIWIEDRALFLLDESHQAPSIKVHLEDLIRRRDFLQRRQQI